MKKKIARQIHIRFFIAAMICFICIMFLALAVYLTYRYMPMPEEETVVLEEWFYRFCYGDLSPAQYGS